MYFKKYLLICFILLIFSSIKAQSEIKKQEMETLISVADTYVESSAPTANHGGADNLHISNNTLGQDIVFVRFDLSGIPGNITLLSFKIYPTFLTETHSIGVHYVGDNSWNENTINYENMPTYEITALDTKLVSTTDTSYSFDLDSLINPSLTMISVAVIAEESTQSGFLFLGDRTVNEFIGEPPKLDVFYLIADDPTTTTPSSIFDQFSSSSTSETAPNWTAFVFFYLLIIVIWKRKK